MVRWCREVLQEHANELNIIPRSGSLQIVLYNEKKGGGGFLFIYSRGYFHTAVAYFPQYPWP